MSAAGRERWGLSRLTALAAGLLQAAAIAWPGSGQALGSLQVFSLWVLCLGLVRMVEHEASPRQMAGRAAMAGRACQAALRSAASRMATTLTPWHRY